LLKEEISFPINLIPLYEKKGDLPWPIEGEVVTHFGLQRHPQFKTTTMNNGIEISPRKNYVIVRAIHPGKVVYSDYFQGYGNLIIVDHGMSYYSLYGHCSEILVKKGDLVKAEHPIALVSIQSRWLAISALYKETLFILKFDSRQSPLIPCNG
jgi:septal ring factor EnvC (AmiA/AmiB activator)